MCVFKTQPDETADTLAALREAKSKGAKVISIVNVVASTIARESDDVIYTMAGPEIAVATTKAFSAQLAVVYLLALRFSKAVGLLPEKREKELTKELMCLPSQIEDLLNLTDELKTLAHKYVSSDDVFFIGRGLNSPLSLEGRLKPKE